MIMIEGYCSSGFIEQITKEIKNTIISINLLTIQQASETLVSYSQHTPVHMAIIWFWKQLADRCKISLLASVCMY